MRFELQIALWAGVTLIAAGAGILVKDNLANLGPVTIGAGIALAAALCLWYVARTAPPFSWGPVASPTLAFDYVLLLGVLLIGTDLAYLETQFKILGPNWPWHLFLLSLIQLAFAFRYDSRAVLSLALASFAAWRGVALSFAGRRAVRAARGGDPRQRPGRRRALRRRRAARSSAPGARRTSSRPSATWACCCCSAPRSPASYGGLRRPRRDLVRRARGDLRGDRRARLPRPALRLLRPGRHRRLSRLPAACGRAAFRDRALLPGVGGELRRALS